MEKQTEIVVDMDTGLNDYLEIGTNRMWMSLTNWRTVQEANKKDPTQKPFILFRADVWKYGESKDLLNVVSTTAPKIFETSHVDFRKKINEILKTRKPSDAVLIGVKTVGTSGKMILYDIEVA